MERVLHGIHVHECCDVVVAKTSEASEIKVKHIGWYYYWNIVMTWIN